MSNDSWVANLSDGSTHVERWIPGEVSPWQRLMNYCKQNGAYVTALRLTVGTTTKACPSNAAGYWQAHGMPSVQGLECDEDLHKWRGIGWVEGGEVHIIWSARDPRNPDNIAFWMDSRSAKNQAQIIWAQQSMSQIPVLQANTDVFSGQADVRNVKEYTELIQA